MAIPMLCTRKGEPYAHIVQRWHDGLGEMQVMELKAFGWEHAQVAAMMCSEWDVPEVNAEADIELLTQRVHESTGLDPSDVCTLVEESFHNAEEVAEQFAA